MFDKHSKWSVDLQQFYIFYLQKETPSDQQLHLAALQGNVEQLRRVLDSGRVHVDCKDKVGLNSLKLHLCGLLKYGKVGVYH
jgi:hypothetical protein